jgi:hypothetical protein
MSTPCQAKNTTFLGGVWEGFLNVVPEEADGYVFRRRRSGSVAQYRDKKGPLEGGPFFA